MSDPNFMSRIGNWFKRPVRPESGSSETAADRAAADALAEINGAEAPAGTMVPEEPMNGEDGDPVATDVNTALVAPANGPSAVTRSTFLRPWAKRDAAIENLQNGLGALSELMGGIRQHMERQGLRQDEMMQHLSQISEALRALPETQRVQGETLKAIHQHMGRQNALHTAQNAQQSKLADILERISQADGRNGRALEALQGRFEVMGRKDSAITESLTCVGVAMETVSRSSEASTQVLSQLRDNLEDRDEEMQKILHRQGNRFTAMLSVAIFLAITALVVASVIGYMGFEALKAVR